MKNDTDIIALRQPESVDDPLTEIARDGARRMLAAALRAEADAFVAQHAEDVLPDRPSTGSVRIHGHGPERSIQTGIGALTCVARRCVTAPPTSGGREKDPVHLGNPAEMGAALEEPRWQIVPVLYLRGLSMGDFQEALAAILGKDAPNLSPSVISRLTGEWQKEYDHWQRRDLSARRYVYMWADGVYLQARMEPQAECMLVISGHAERARRNLLASRWAFAKARRAGATAGRLEARPRRPRSLSVMAPWDSGRRSTRCFQARHQRCWVRKSYAQRGMINRFLVSLSATPSVNVTPSMTWKATGWRPSGGAMSSGGLNELEDHELRRLLRQRALGSARSGAEHGGEDALDRVAGTQVIPVVGGKS